MNETDITLRIAAYIKELRHGVLESIVLFEDIAKAQKLSEEDVAKHFQAGATEAGYQVLLLGETSAKVKPKVNGVTFRGVPDDY